MGAEMRSGSSSEVTVLLEKLIPLGQVPRMIRGLSVFIGILGVALAVIFPLGARPGTMVIALAWILLLKTLQRGLPMLKKKGSRLRLAVWVSAAAISTIWFFSQIPFADMMPLPRQTAPQADLLIPLLLLLLIFVGLPILGLLLAATGVVVGIFAIFKTGEKAVYGLSGSQLKRTLHARGYGWITHSDAERLLKDAGRAAFRLPDCDHIGTLPGYCEGNVQTLVPIVRLFGGLA